MATIFEFYAHWKEKVPAEADLEDVRQVVLHFFGSDNIRAAATGSHVLIVDGLVTKLAAKLRDAGESRLAWLDGETFSIPAHKGRTVKRVYIANLLKLIEVWGEVQAIMKTKQGKP